MTATPTGKGHDRDRDESLHGLLVALGITGTIAAVVIVFAYASHDGDAFDGITEALTPLQNDPVVADLMSSTTSVQDEQAQEAEEQQQKIDQEQEPVASQVGSQNDLVEVEKQTDTDTKTVEVPVRSDESLQFVDMVAHEIDSGNNDSTPPTSASQAVTSPTPEVAQEEKKEKEKQEKKWQKLLAEVPDTLCPPAVGGIDSVEANGECQTDTTVNENVKADATDDSVNFDSGSLDGNIEAKDRSDVNVGSGASINGNVKSENTTDTNIGVATVRGNIEVKDGNLKILSGAEIFGNVKHEGSGICVVAEGAIIHGNIEGCPAS